MGMRVKHRYRLAAGHRVWQGSGRMRAVRAILCALLLAGAAASGAAPERPAEPAPLPGVALARAVSETTGLAISPLLGAGAYGAYRYWRTAPELRDRLPWYARPWFWVPALLLVGLAALKDLWGTGTPAILKKPLDVAELLENQLSGLLVGGAIVPLLLLTPAGAPDSSLSAGMGPLAWIEPLSWAGNAALLVVLWVMFAGVFLVFHAIQVLIVLSPFGVVDLMLKIARAGLLGTVVAAAWVHPWLGALWSLVIVLVCWWVAGWAFRLTILGTVLSWDLLSGARTRFTVKEPGPILFLAQRVGGVPVRTAGRLVRTDSGGWLFRYRPWGLGPCREVPLPEGRYEVGRGLVFPELLRLQGDEARSVGWWPPRCRGHEADLCRFYRLDGVRDTVWRRAWSWFREVVRGGVRSLSVGTGS